MLRYGQVLCFSIYMLIISTYICQDHELRHVYLHLLNDNQADFIDVDKNDIDYVKSKEEKEADEFASNHLIEKESWSEFYKKNAQQNDKTITQFARKNRINPAIIKGRISHLTGTYAWKTKISNIIK